MKYNIIITHIGNAKAKNIIARHLAHDPSISLQKALSILDNLPVVYQTGILQDDAQVQIRQLEKIQCKAKLEPVKNQASPQKNVKPFMPEYTAPPQPPQEPAPAPKPISQAPHALHTTIIVSPLPQKTFFTKKKIAIGSILFIVVVIALFVVIGLNHDSYNWTHASTLDWSKTGMLPHSEMAKNTDKKPISTKKNAQVREQKAQQQSPAQKMQENGYPSPEQIAQAQLFCDSAKKAISVSQAISFYKLAIAFNNKNIAAWYSLREAYTQAMMTGNVAETEESMKRIFGENIFSVSKSIEQFGEAKNLFLTPGGVYRIEYQPNEPYKKNYLLNSFLLMKAMRNSCQCNAISLNLVAHGSTELLVYARTEPFPATFDEFKATATITSLK